jgi:uncharacterized protein
MKETEATGNLLHNMVLFGRLLRALGLDVNPGRLIDLVQALAHIEIGQRDDFYHTCRSLLVHHKDDLHLFDQAFDLFWYKMWKEGIPIDLFGRPFNHPQPQTILVPPALKPEEEKADANKETAEQEDPDQTVIEVTKTYSIREQLRHKDFSQLTAEEVQAVKRVMAQLVWQLGQRRTRRRQPGRGHWLDFRRSLRRNLRYGGEMLQWSRREYKFKPRPLVVIADISGSMERYTALLLHFLYSLAEGLNQPVESFVFSTRLTRTTRQLRGRDIERALAEVSATVTDWAGGTRIGQAIKMFNFEWGRRVLGQGAVVVLISDGWDRGDPGLLREEIARLQRSCHRLIWLNPLLGSADYEPLTRGMQAALPHIDDFLPVHNLASLEDLAQHLANLTDGKRPLRRHQIRLSGAAFIK